METYIIPVWIMLIGIAVLGVICILWFQHVVAKQTLRGGGMQKSRYRYAAALGGLILICCLIGALTSTYPIQMKDMFVTSSIEIMEKNLEDSATFINEDVKLNYQQMRMIAQAVSSELDGTEQYNDKLLEVLRSMKNEAGFEQIGVVKMDSGYPLAVTSDGERVEVSIRLMAEPVEKNKVSVAYHTSPFRTSGVGSDAVVFRTMVTDRSGAQYMLIAEKPREALNSILNISEDKDDDEASLVIRDNGNVVYGTGKIAGREFVNYNLYSYLDRLSPDGTTADDIRAQLTGTTFGHTEITLNGENYFLVYHKIEDTDWVCVNIYSESYLAGANLQTVSQKTMKLVMVVMLLLLFAFVISVIAVSLIVKQQGEKKVMEKEKLFEKMSGCIPSAFVILREGSGEPEFISQNLDQVLDGMTPAFSSKALAEWLDVEITAKDRRKFYETGRYVTVVPKNERFYQFGAYDIGLVDEKQYYVIVFENVTEEVNSHNLLEDSMKRADAASKSKTKFLSKMSHEIRTPLNSIIGFSKLAADGWDTTPPEELRDYVRKIQHSGDFLLELVSDVLDISRIEEGRMELALTPINLDELVDEVASAFQGQMKRKNLEFVVDKHYQNMILNMDGFHTKQILNNLISNSCKYTESGGCVGFEINAEPLDETHMGVQFIVQDTGIGMSEQFLQKIFEPFTQDECGMLMKNQLRGSGLGMSICKNLVELQNGTINVESTVGEGSCFTVQFTYEIIRSAEEQAKVEAEVTTDYSFLRGKKILVVDDIDLNRMIVQKYLEKYGVEFEYAENGQEAVEKFEQSEDGFFTIFMDIQMPVMNGYEAAKAIRKSAHPQAKTVVIAAMSADAFSDDVNRAIMSGMNYHIAKPVQLERMLKVLAEIESKRGSKP